MIIKTSLGIKDIMEILPHRTPFIFVDRVVAFRPGETITVEKDFHPEEIFFKGHFPGNPVVPGVMVSEALAQACGLLVGLTGREEVGEGRKGARYMLASMNIKFLVTLKPPATLRLEARVLKEYGKLYLFGVEAEIGGRKVAKGKITLAGVN